MFPWPIESELMLVNEGPRFNLFWLRFLNFFFTAKTVFNTFSALELELAKNKHYLLNYVPYMYVFIVHVESISHVIIAAVCGKNVSISLCIYKIIPIVC